ncbi:PKD domain-containing protein [Hymenobacter nivis]|uniref:PKD domain-containing protein n=1 Tax=Hymenobacter nivis TaxID=1850093 RepID=A0A502HEA8_9BACT|nr:PKD domain-containing protein [Hymenobacter nivis]TPG72344.1 PKD domain-containing protein [Hymenobacter nivis]
MRSILTLLGLGTCLAAVPLLPRLGAPAPGLTAEPRPVADPNSRIGGELQQLYRLWNTAARGQGPQLAAAFPELTLADGNAVLVRITARDVAALRPALLARGFEVVSDQSKLHFIEGRLPMGQLAPGAAGISALAAQGLLGVLPVFDPINSAGKVLNQADFVLEASRVRGAQPTGYDGTGVRIGVMSDSYNALGGAAAGVASGDLPANVQVLQDPATGTDEGRAMLELIHDLAPGAGKAFSGIYQGEANFADQIYKLADPTLGNCKIIVDDISYLNEPMFQDGVIAQAVEEVVATRGVAYYSSAGNYADKSSEYVAPTFTATTGGAADLDFGLSTGATTDTRQPFTIAASGTFQLAIQWSDPFYTTNGVKTDLDAYLVVARAGGPVKGDTVARATTNNLANQTPGEIISYTNPAAATNTAFNLVMARRAGTADPARVKYIGYGASFTPTKYWTRSGTVTGHHASVNSMSVAAAPSYNRLAPESFTSKGTPTYLFGPLGAPLAAPVTRLKPDFTSIDFVSNTFFGGNATPDPADGLFFSGTSAAAPNAAAVAALLWQAQPALTQAQLNDRLRATATDMLAAGYDDQTGAGLINAYAAVFGLPLAATAPFVETFDNAGLSRAWQIEGRGAGRSLVRTDFAPASAPGQLVLDNFIPTFTIGVGTSEATLRLNLSAASATGYVLNFKHKKILGETDQAMPATFTTTSPTDGVALSVDGGTTWYSLASITGTNATTSYKTVSVNLTQFATTNNLVLGADVRVRFQRYGASLQVDAAVATRRGGRAFDDVTVSGGTGAPVAFFTSSATAAALCPGSTVQFTDASLLSPTAWNWSFPGGTPATSTVQNPVVTYPTAGTYAATLTVTNATGTATRTTAAVVTVSGALPVANFTARQALICPGGKIGFTNTSTQCVGSISWSFPGGSPATSTAASPVVTYATAGTYTATLTATNANGSTTKSIPVTVQGTALAIPYTETLAAGIPATWGVLNPDNGITWATATNILLKDGTRGSAADMNFYDYGPAVGQRDTLQTPAFNLNQPMAFLRFDVAYAPAGPIAANNNDSLAVDVYTACTNTRLGRVYLKSAADGLPTTLFRQAAYAPTATSQWRTENIDLAAYLNKQVYLRFVAFNQYGNHLYLSNVRVGNTVLATKALADSPALQVYPNPVAGGRSLALALPLGSGTAALRLVDALGRTAWHGTAPLSPTAAARRTLDAPLAPGLYTVLCQAADGQLYSRRVVVE